MIASRQNQRLKDIRRLRRSKGDRALLEGPHLVAEAVAAGLVLEDVLAVPGYFEADGEGRELRSVLAALPRAPVEVAPDVLAGLADADAPKGLLAVVHLARGGVESLPVPGPGARASAVYLYLEGLQDPGNLGAVARSAEAAGALGIALAPGSAHPNHPRALRGSAGSLLRLPVAREVTPDALDRHLGRPRWAALVPRDGESLWRADLAGPLVLAVGAEGPGLSPALVERADLRLTVPLAAPVESLNAAVAAALVLFEIRRRSPADSY